MSPNLSMQTNPSERVIHILDEERIEVMQLRRYLMQVRTALEGRVGRRIQDLLNGLFLGITRCSDILTVRVNSLAFDSIIGPRPSLVREYRWKIPAEDTADCRELLHSVQAAYAHCARTTAESMSAIASLGDVESSAILRWVSSTTKEALWFIEIYLEGLAVGMDCGNLPAWNSANQPGKSSTVLRTFSASRSK